MPANPLTTVQTAMLRDLVKEGYNVYKVINRPALKLIELGYASKDLSDAPEGLMKVFPTEEGKTFIANLGVRESHYVPAWEHVSHYLYSWSSTMEAIRYAERRFALNKAELEKLRTTARESAK